MRSCWKCGQSLTPLHYGRADSCPQCRSDTRVCKNCEYFEASLNNECRETQAERVVDKERSNFCDFFLPSDAGFGKKTDSREALRQAADALFKKKG